MDIEDVAGDEEGGLAPSATNPTRIVQDGPTTGAPALRRKRDLRDAGAAAHDVANSTMDAMGPALDTDDNFDALLAQLDAEYGYGPPPVDTRYTNGDLQPVSPDDVLADVAKALLPVPHQRADGTTAPAKAKVLKADDDQTLGDELDEDLDKAVAALDRLAKGEDDDPPEKPDNPDKPPSKKTDTDRMLEKLGAPPPPKDMP